MTDPRAHPTREQDEAAEWFARLGKRSATTQGLSDFGDWLDNPANEAAYEEVERFWETSGKHAGDPAVLRMTEAALARRHGVRLPPWLRGPPLAWTSALAGLAAASLAVYAANEISPTYSTKSTAQRAVLLSAGARGHLNVDSKVRVAFGRAERRLPLSRGDAFFGAAHDGARPFIVEADGAALRAVGAKSD